MHIKHVLGADISDRTRSCTWIFIVLLTIGMVNLVLSPSTHVVWMAFIFACGVYIVTNEVPKMMPKSMFWGALYWCVIPSWCAVNILQNQPVLLVWGSGMAFFADIAAFVTGRAFGGPKLCSISPNKTWSGLLGAITACMLVTLILSWLDLLPFSPLTGLFIAPLVTLMAAGGDIYQSYLKRKAGIKDAGDLLSGMGGLSDRLDSHVPVCILIGVFIQLHG